MFYLVLQKTYQKKFHCYSDWRYPANWVPCEGFAGETFSLLLILLWDSNMLSPEWYQTETVLWAPWVPVELIKGDNYKFKYC